MESGTRASFVIFVFILIVFTIPSMAAPPAISIIDPTSSESIGSGIGCVQRGGGASSYFDFTQGTPETFGVRSVADSSAVATVLPTNIPCYGASGTGSDTWTWSQELRIDGDLGAQATINGEIDIQWYRQFVVVGLGDSSGDLEANIEFYFQGPDGRIPIRNIAIDENETSRAVVPPVTREDWRDRSFFLSGIIVGDPVYGSVFVEGTFRVRASVDLDNPTPGTISSTSVALYSLRGTVRAEPSPTPTPKAIPVLPASGLGLLAMFIAILAGMAYTRKI